MFYCLITLYITVLNFLFFFRASLNFLFEYSSRHSHFKRIRIFIACFCLCNKTKGIQKSAKRAQQVQQLFHYIYWVWEYEPMIQHKDTSVDSYGRTTHKRNKRTENIKRVKSKVYLFSLTIHLTFCMYIRNTF